MKAKEYVEKYGLWGEPDMEAFDHKIIDVIGEMVPEFADLRDARKAQSDEALIAIVKELEQKFQAILRHAFKGVEFPDGMLDRLVERQNRAFQAVFIDCLVRRGQDQALFCRALGWDPENPLLRRNREAS